jgi:hypothetical protein
MMRPLLPRCSWCYMGAGILRTTRGNEPVRLCRSCSDVLGWPPGRIPAYQRA